jgi:L-lactate dehydrogenase complex protein LldF
LYNRRDAVKNGDTSWIWNTGMKAFGYAFINRKRLDMVGGDIKNKMGIFGKDVLGDKKTLPTFAKQSFSQQWKNKQ